MQRSTNRILTTHTGSLPRPKSLVELMVARESGEPVDASRLEAEVEQAVSAVVSKQVETGVDVVNGVVKLSGTGEPGLAKRRESSWMAVSQCRSPA